MGWQQRSSGRKYDSDSGHGMMIGMHSRKIIGFKIKSKQCRICKVAAKKNIPAPKHICCRNHLKSSKAMEVDVILELCVEHWDKKGVSIAYIVSDDDTTMRSNLKHSLQEKIDAGMMSVEDWPRTSSGRKKKIATVGSHYVSLNLYFSRIRLIEKRPLERICTLLHPCLLRKVS